MDNGKIFQAYEMAKEKYAKFGVDVDTTLKSLKHMSLSIHCWQGDDVGGFEKPDSELSGEEIQVTGNYPGKARNIDEPRMDLKKVYSLIPGKHRLNLHAIYGDFGGKYFKRDQIAPEYFKGWIEWTKENNLKIDFNSTCFSHPMTNSGFTLSSKNKFLILAIIFGIILHKTTIGRKVFAIGNNSTAARFSGIPVNRIRLIIFTVTGLCSGLASILLTSRIGSTRPNIASGWELEIITTVVLGGVAITGGKGNIFGVIISIFIIGFLKFGMGLINIPGKVMTIIIGLLLILAIMLPQLLERLKPKYSFGNVKK